MRRLRTWLIPGCLVALAPLATAQGPEAGGCPPGYVLKPSEDTGPPRLRRGVPEEYRREPGETEAPAECVRAETVSEVVVSEEGRRVEHTQPPPGYDEFLLQVRDRALAFHDSLPNFICTELVYRFESDVSPARWRLKDRVSAEVLMVDGEETYQNLSRDGRPVREGRLAATGQWSRGEYGSVMEGLFADRSRVRFTYQGNSEIAGKRARRYRYEVAEANSLWRVEFDGKEIFPAYEGAIWVDPDELRILRIEMQARDIASDYPIDVIEMTVDYGPVSIAGREHIVPIRSENLACRRGARLCSRNETEFRDYRRFTAESVIRSTDSTIEYDGRAEP